MWCFSTLAYSSRRLIGVEQTNSSLLCLALNIPVNLLWVTFAFVGFGRIPHRQVKKFSFWSIVMSSTCKALCFQLYHCSIFLHNTECLSLREFSAFALLHCCRKWQSGMGRSNNISTLIFNWIKFRQWNKKNPKPHLLINQKSPKFGYFFPQFL